MKRFPLKRISALAIVLLMDLGLKAWCQTDQDFPYSSRDDISVGYGWMLPLVQGDMGSDCSEGTIVRLDYRHFYLNRAGFAIGAQHVRNYMDVDGSVGMPLSFVCRTELHDFGELVGDGIRNAMDNDPFENYDPYYIQENVKHPVSEGFMSDIAVFLMSLVNRAEFKAGLTPGYVYGDGKTHHSAYSIISEGKRYDWSGMKGSEVGNRFCLTADVGANISYRIWHFCINLNPEVHYILTDSYRIYSKPDNGLADTKTQRWQFSFMFSLNLML